LIAIVDYDAGNLHSVAKGAEAVGLRARATSLPGDLEAADGVILPGVGSFPDCMTRLASRGLIPPLERYLAADRPFLGICLGLQLLFEWGEEGAGAAGLGFLPGPVLRIQAPGRKIPQMGWNALRFRRRTPLFDGIPEGEYFYFVHSFHARPARAEDLVADVDYGEPVTAAVARGRVHAVQFHPEKSSAAGLRLLANFGRLVAEAPR
jgi:glutamine amidotransferase